MLFVAGCSNQQKKTTDADIEIEDIINKMSLKEKIDMIGGYDQFNIRPNKPLGIPEIKMTDGPLGVRSINGEATAFPASIALAASWDRKLVEKVGAAIAQEAKAKDKNILLAPGMNIYRAPMAGRNFEYLGEDPYLTGEMAVSYINGVQKEGVVATATGAGTLHLATKWYSCNSAKPTEIIPTKAPPMPAKNRPISLWQTVYLYSLTFLSISNFS